MTTKPTRGGTTKKKNFFAASLSKSVKCISCRIKGFQKKFDLVAQLLTYRLTWTCSLTDKVTHRGAQAPKKIRAINGRPFMKILLAEKEIRLL